MSFQLPRRGREQYDNTKVLVTHLNWMENRIMAALEDVVAELRSAIENANTRFQGVGQIEQALADERAKFEALVTAEDAEDVQQNQELADAKAATDAALAQVQGLSDTLSGLTDQVNQLGAAAPAEAEGTGEVPTPGPGGTAPVDASADADASVPTPTPAPASDDNKGGDAAPVDAGTPTPVVNPGAPTDADGNAVTPPAV